MPSLSPVELLRRDREAAERLAQGVGRKRTLAILERAQNALNQRLHRAESLMGPGRGSYTATQLRATLLQIRAVTAGLKVDLKGVTVTQGKEAAALAAESAARYLRVAEQRFHGSTARLSLDMGRLVDRAQSGAEASVLRRLMSNPNDPRGAGILDRYGNAVVGHFEDVLQQQLVARTPWHEVRDQLTAASPFLQEAPAHWSERIVRTETMNSHGKASHEAIVQADDQLGDMVKIISSTFDDRTGADSFAVHGQIRRPSESFQSWFGSYMHPPDRPNDRSVVVPHRISWPIPAELKPKDGGAIASRWAREGRKGAPPSQPLISTVPLSSFGKPPPPSRGQPEAQANESG